MIKLLIADDEWAVRHAVALYLREMGFEVFEAKDGAEALALFEAHPVDLALLDLNMPKMSGQETLAALRQRAPELPTIIISGTGEVRDVAEVLRLGAWDYITKPILDTQILIHAINKALERARLLRENKEHSARLEAEVARRTQQLRATNQELHNEIAERKIAEARLIDTQRLLRQLNSELSRAEEGERSRIAQGLHDEVSQKLSVSKLMLQTLKRSLGQDPHHKQLDLPINILDECLSEIRTLTFALSPQALLEMGLSSALEWQAERLQERHGTHFEFQCTLKHREVTSALNALLFRSFGELLTNACKYAQAKHVLIQSWTTAEESHFMTEDDGQGFDAKILEQRVGQPGFGLLSIRERFEYQGGQMRIRTRRGVGTQVILSLPNEILEDEGQFI